MLYDIVIDAVLRRYPVTLSLENHCSIDQQSVMARHLEEILGDMIWSPDTELTAIPTPEELMHKIVIKVTEAALLSMLVASECQHLSVVAFVARDCCLMWFVQK